MMRETIRFYFYRKLTKFQMTWIRWTRLMKHLLPLRDVIFVEKLEKQAKTLRWLAANWSLILMIFTSRPDQATGFLSKADGEKKPFFFVFKIHLNSARDAHLPSQNSFWTWFAFLLSRSTLVDFTSHLNIQSARVPSRCQAHSLIDQTVNKRPDRSCVFRMNYYGKSASLILCETSVDDERLSSSGKISNVWRCSHRKKQVASELDSTGLMK